ncbi:hypothetical protein H7J86_00580 [Mycobacterium hackensackense]|uniref:hypothetical protein n=1 Tax=Mycobacterium hackensackense TaxID=228909 RepID=UPI002265C9D6|nr:hypothetical protein [Mycobacterium hackensackense]MCV7250655.1 hypothetical protein [Mycobacterium hackensackense]
MASGSDEPWPGHAALDKAIDLTNIHFPSHVGVMVEYQIALTRSFDDCSKHRSSLAFPDKAAAVAMWAVVSPFAKDFRDLARLLLAWNGEGENPVPGFKQRSYLTVAFPHEPPSERYQAVADWVFEEP